MDAKEKMSRLLVKTLGLFSNLTDEGGKPSEAGESLTRLNDSEMVRVTDSRGCEYLCPVGKLRNINFVSEREKDNCVDYSRISRHDAIES